METGWLELSFDVKDIVATRDFYVNLGFEVVDEAFDGRVVTLQRTDCRLCLYQGFLDPKETQLIFWQGDVEATTRDLAERGVRVEKPLTRDDAGGVSALVRDPDGRAVCFVNLPGVVRR